MEYGPASLRAWSWCRRHGRAYVIFSDCTPQINALLSPAQLRLHRWLARRADGVIAVSSAGRERLLAFGVPPERITVALQSGDLEPVRSAASTAPAAGTGPAAGGRQRRPAGARQELRDADRGVLAAGPSAGAVRLEIAGTGFARAPAAGAGARLGVPVRFHGASRPPRCPGSTRSADIFALVSTYEPFGVAIREAAAAGLPIVCSRTAGAAGDIAVDGRNAVLVDPARPDEVAAALARLIADASLRERMGAESRAMTRRLDGRPRPVPGVDAFGAAVLAAIRASAGSTSSRRRRTWLQAVGLSCSRAARA